MPDRPASSLLPTLLATAAVTALGCGHRPPARSTARASSASASSASSTAAVSASHVTLTVFEGSPGTATWPVELPRFAPLSTIVAACPALHPTATIALPRAAGATARFALPDGGEAAVAWDGDPRRGRIVVAGVPRTRAGVRLTYALVAGPSILFWGAVATAAGAGPCAYVVVGDGRRAAR